MTDRAAKIAELERLRARDAKIAELEGLRAQDSAALQPKQEESPADKMGFVDRVAYGAEGAVEDVLAGPVGRGLAWVGDKVERYVDAPVRAQVSSLQRGESLGQSFERGGEQLGKEPLPTTQSGKQIFTRLDFSTKPLSEFLPGAFSETGEGVKLKKGGPFDVSHAGVAGAVMQPSMWINPGAPLVSAAPKVAGAAAKAGKTIATPIVEFSSKAGQAAQKGVFNVGELMTGGNLKASRAAEAANRLKGTQLIAPDASVGGAGRAVGEAREGIKAHQAARIGGLPVEGGREAMERIKNIIEKGEIEAQRHPGSQEYLRKIDHYLESGEPIQLSTVDNLIQNLNSVEYTALGNQRQLEPLWKKPVANVRAELNTLLNSVEEGRNLQTAKYPYEALKTAQGVGQGSKARGIASLALGSTLGTAAAYFLGPQAALAIAVGARSFTPRTYYQLVGVAKLPKQAADSLLSSYQTGNIGKMREALQSAAEKYPAEISRFATAVSNEMAKGGNGTALERRKERTP